MGKMLLSLQEKPISRTFVLIPLSPYAKYFLPNVSVVDLIPKLMSFRYNLMVDCWLFIKLLVKYDSDFFTRGNVIEGYIATASID